MVQHLLHLHLKKVVFILLHSIYLDFIELSPLTDEVLHEITVDHFTDESENTEQPELDVPSSSADLTLGTVILCI